MCLRSQTLRFIRWLSPPYLLIPSAVCPIQCANLDPIHEMFMQVLGAKPLESASHLKTNQLAKAMIEYLKASDDVLEVYISHLALLVC